MTNLETFYGVKISIDRSLEAFSLDILQDRAKNLELLKGIDVNQFHIYYHKIYIYNSQKKRFFGKHIAMNQRIKNLDVTFKVNQKQRRKESIRFFNSYVEPKFLEGVEWLGGDDYELRRVYNLSLLKTQHLETELITFIDKSRVNKKHEKITVTIVPQPTPSYDKSLKSRKIHMTDISLPLIDEFRIFIRSDLNTIDSSNDSILNEFIFKLKALKEEMDSVDIKDGVVSQVSLINDLSETISKGKKSKISSQEILSTLQKENKRVRTFIDQVGAGVTVDFLEKFFNNNG